MYNGYVFFCNGETQQQCINNKKYVCAEKQNKPAEPIKRGAIIFLYNPEAETLLGPFTALNEGAGELDSGAWKMSVDENIPSEDIKVTWEQLHILRNALQKAPLFKTLKPCQLTSIETQNILDLLAQGEPYIEEKTEN